MNPLQRLKQQKQLLNVIGSRQAGIFKRLDENRELLELLIRETPALLRTHPWVVGWLASQDDFLQELAIVSGINHQKSIRPWPLPVLPIDPINSWPFCADDEKSVLARAAADDKYIAEYLAQAPEVKGNTGEK